MPEGVQDKAPPDILPIMQMVNDKCCSISPQIQDYKEAEFRTSYREAPHPKNPEGEEMRDRLIWCQSLRLSKETGNPVLIVSADTIFRNGALSDEGKDARISVVESAGDFDQRLGERPQHISTLIQSLLTFSPELAKKGVDLSEENVRGIEVLRKILNSDGSITQRFFLLISNATGVESRYSATMNSVGDQPLSIDLETNPPISIHRNLSEQELLELEGRRLQSFRGDAISSLRRLIGSS